MLNRFLESLQSSCRISPGGGVLLAVSGGPDSMAMLHLFCEARQSLQLQLEVAHLNHRIRGKEAGDDAVFVEQACKSLELPFRLFRFDVPEFARREKLSIEEVGRRIRHHFLGRYARARNLDYVAFAHTADDQAETILLNLARGAGPRGLAGISRKRKQIIHPMLSFTKSEILAFLHENKIAYHEDKSNLEPLYSRNRLRLEILPYLQERLGFDFRSNLIRAGEIFRDEEEWIDELIFQTFRERFQELSQGIFKLRISCQENLPVALQRRLVRKFLETTRGRMTGINFSHVEEILALLLKQAGRRFEFSDCFVERISDGLALSLKAEPWKGELCVEIPGVTSVTSLNVRVESNLLEMNSFADVRGSRRAPIRGRRTGSASPLRPVWDKDDRTQAFMDWDAICAPVRLRTRRDGDFLWVLGLGNKKKLQDYFVDRKVPRLLRDRIPLLVCEQGILWVSGHDVDHRFRITERTKRILHLRLIHGAFRETKSLYFVRLQE